MPGLSRTKREPRRGSVAVAGALSANRLGGERVLEIAEIERVLPRVHERREAVRIIQEKAETVYPKS